MLDNSSLYVDHLRHLPIAKWVMPASS